MMETWKPYAGRRKITKIIPVKRLQINLDNFPWKEDKPILLAYIYLLLSIFLFVIRGFDA